MIKQKLKIEDIPAILWGDRSDKLFVVVHGNMSNKEDDFIGIFAEEAILRGYQVLSFDLPEHGERKEEDYPCKVQNCVKDLGTIMDYAKSLANNINVFASSMGAYFSLLTYGNESLKTCLFLSPVVNMEGLINNMMTYFNVSEERLKLEKEISIANGPIFYWDYYCYVKEHPIVSWNKPTSILYGAKDNLCEAKDISSFVKSFNCDLKVMENGEHYFHTEEQLGFFREWVKGKMV